jgi:hypothetical protein
MPDTPEPTATVAGQSIALHLTNYPDIPNQWGTGHIRPTNIRLDYGNQRTPHARAAYITGLWVREDGQLTDATLDRDYYAPNGDLGSWPPEIADLANKHQPDPVAPSGRADVLREEAARIRAHCPDHLDSDSADGAWMACHCDVADDIERRLAAETEPVTQDAKPWLTDSARIGRTLIWSWADVGKGAFREGYRAAQAEARALLGGERGTDQRQPTTAHSCGNCEGIDPDSCLTNLDRPAARAQRAVKQTPGTEGEWCKCRSCWGWFVEEHPGEDLDELGRDLGWWSGLPVHRDAPAGMQTDEEA